MKAAARTSAWKLSKPFGPPTKGLVLYLQLEPATVYVIDAQGRPVEGVELACFDDVLSTDATGSVRSSGIEGELQMRPLNEVAYWDCFELIEVKAGDHRSSTEPSPLSSPGRSIAELYRRPVTDSDSWQSLAESTCLSPQALQHFNFGTSEPELVDKGVQFQFGGTGTGHDGCFVFHENPLPGIILLPEPPREFVEQHTTLVVKPIESLVQKVRFGVAVRSELLDNERFRAVFPNLGEFHGVTDAEGVLEAPHPKSAEYMDVYLPDCGNFVFSVGLTLRPPIDSIEGVQVRLASYRYYLGAFDGELGPKTETAIVRFQVQQGLYPSGALDDETRGLLETMPSPNYDGPVMPLDREPEVA